MSETTTNDQSLRPTLKLTRLPNMSFRQSKRATKYATPHSDYEPFSASTFGRGANLTFITDPQGSGKRLAQTGEIRKCFSELNSYIDSFDSKLDNYLSRQEETYMEKYREFIQSKQNELRGMQERFESTVGHQVQILKDQQIKELRAEIEGLYSRMTHMSTMYTNLEREQKRMRIRVANTEEDNEFLRQQIKDKIQESNQTRIALQDLCLDLDQQVTARNKPRDEDILLVWKDRCGKLEQSLRAAVEKVSKLASTKQGLGNLLEAFEAYTEKSKGAVKGRRRMMTKGNVENVMKTESRSRSVGKATDREKEETYRRHIELLREKNFSFEKQTLRAKSKAAFALSRSTELQEIFMECVKTTKREIYKRKLGLQVGCNNSSMDVRLVDPKKKHTVTSDVTNTLRKLQSDPAQIEAKLREFTSDDRVNLVTLFVCNERLIHYIYEFLFPGPEPVSSFSTTMQITEENRVLVTGCEDTHEENIHAKAEAAAADGRAQRKCYSRLREPPTGEARKALDTSDHKELTGEQLQLEQENSARRRRKEKCWKHRHRTYEQTISQKTQMG